MKNQVNKKVSKLLIALLSLVIMSVACVSFAACNKECTHSKFKLSEDTATCVAGGFITHTCEDCGYAYMEPTAAKGHDYDTAVVVPATCTTDGYTVKTCKVCGHEEKTNPTAATGHLQTSEVVVNATCTANGYKKTVCQDCGTVVNEEVLLATGHKFTDTVVAPTCKDAGYTIRVCATCNEKVTVIGEPATGNHDYIEASRTEATCNAAGFVVEKCSVCGAEHTTILPATGVHAYGEVTVVDATCLEAAHKEHTCKNCGYVEHFDETGDKANHSYEEIAKVLPTCTTKGIKVEECTVCGKKQTTEIDMEQHHWTTELTVEAATCEKDGSKYYYCTVCGKKDVAETIPATGHKYVDDVVIDATCTSYGSKTTKCEYCGNNGPTTKIEKLAHEYDENLKKIVEATCTAGGYTLETCKNCGLQIKTNLTEATGHTWEETSRVEATCTVNGSLVETCKKCKISNTTVIVAAGHNYVATPVAATCTAPEMVKNVCSVCGYETAATVVEGGQPALEHEWETTEIVPATCLNAGYEIRTCHRENCGETEKIVLERVEHTYAITDSMAENVAIETLFAEGGKYAYLPAWQQANILSVYETVMSSEVLKKEYYTATEATCTAGGQVNGRCDICHVRYAVGSTEALGHVWGNAKTLYENTCYSDGYTAWECKRCHAQAAETDTVLANVRTSIVPAKAHEMTIGGTAGLAEKVIYAKYVDNKLTYYNEAACTTELTIAECNVLFVDSNEGKFVYYCDHCGALANEENKIATKAYVPTGVSKERPVTLEGKEMTVYTTEEIMAPAGRLVSADHDFEGVEAKIDPEEIINCGYVSRSYISCKTCGGRDGEYAAYNKTNFKVTEETYARPSTTVDPVVSNYRELNYTEHYEIYSYRTYYHQAVAKASAMTCVEKAEYVYVCGRNAIAGEQAECANYYDITGKTYDDVKNSGKTLSKGVASTVTTVDDGATVTYTYTKIEKVNAPEQVGVVVANYLASLTDEEKEAFNERDYYELWDETFTVEGVYTNAFVTEKAAGHKFGTAYTILSFDGENTYSAKSCNAKYLIAVLTCTKCGEYNYIGANGIGETDLINVTDENGVVSLVVAKESTGILVNTDKKLANVKHGVAVADAEGNLSWTNVKYKNAANVNCTADAEGAIAYAINPEACDKDCTEEHTHKYGCEDFTCTTCGTNVLGNHVYDRDSGEVDCWNRQNCVLCGTVTKNYSHVAPTATCSDLKWKINDGNYHCEICGAALGTLTAHNVVVTLEKPATCTTDGVWKVHCTLCDLDVKNGDKVEGLTANADFVAQYGAAITAATDSATGITTFNIEWLKGATALGHDWTDQAYAEANTTAENELYKASTCTEKGYWYSFCKRDGCGQWREGTSDNGVEDKAQSKVELELAPHNYVDTDWTTVTDATCTTVGKKHHFCTVCGGAEVTKDIDALGHKIVLIIDKSGAQDCVNGYPVKKDDAGKILFYCANGCGIDAANITEENSEGVQVAKRVVYQKDVTTKYGADINGETANKGDAANEKLVSELLAYVVGHHTFTTFDMQNGHANEANPGIFTRPEGDKKGSAYWYCSVCEARVYRPETVSQADIDDPAKNKDWMTEVAPSISEIKVEGITLDFALTTEVYFDLTREGYVLKAAKIDALVDAIYAKIVAAKTTTTTVPPAVEGGEETTTTTTAWPITCTINGESITLTDGNVDTDKASIKAALANVKYTNNTKLVVTIA